MYALIWLSLIAGMLPEAPKSILVYPTLAKCESAAAAMSVFAGSKVWVQGPSGSFVAHAVENSFTCVPAYWESR